MPMRKKQVANTPIEETQIVVVETGSPSKLKRKGKVVSPIVFTWVSKFSFFRFLLIFTINSLKS